MPKSIKETPEGMPTSRREALKQISVLAGTIIVSPTLLSNCAKESGHPAPVGPAPVGPGPVGPTSCTTPDVSAPHTTAAFDPDDEYYDQFSANAETATTQWNMRRIGAREAWEPGAGGGSGDVTLYLFDAGVRLDHPDLPPYATVPTAARLTQFSFNQLSSLSGVNLSTEVPDLAVAAPASANGTRMAGILVSTWGSGPGSGISGLAPACEFISLRVTDQGVPPPLTPGDVVAAINTAGFDSTARGKRGVLCLATDTALLQDTLMMPIAAAALAAHPNLLVVAPTGVVSAPYPGAVPANLVICGATDKTNLNTSRYDDWKVDGGPGDEGSREGPDLCVVAPGVGIITSDLAGLPPYTQNAHGTPIAAAHVAGIAALVRSRNPALVTGAAVRRRLEQTAARTGQFDYRTTGPSGPWNQYMGFGRIHATAALVSELDHDPADSQRADVTIRDNPTDVGGRTSCSDFRSSSDVVVLTEAVRAASFPNLVMGVTTDGSAADLAFSTARDAALSSTRVSRGTDTWLFVRVVNLGPNTAFGVRVTAVLAAGTTGHLYPRDWEVATPGMAVVVRPTVVGDDYAHEVPNGGVFIARLRIPAGADYSGFSSNEACVLARVLACNDVTFLRTAPVSDTADQVSIHNNLAQRNMSLVV